VSNLITITIIHSFFDYSTSFSPRYDKIAIFYGPQCYFIAKSLAGELMNMALDFIHKVETVPAAIFFFAIKKI
jgi:hypothetical protein